MPCCYICTSKLYAERTQVCSSITPHSDTPYPQKIAEMLGEEFVAIVTPTDQMCLKCSSLLNHLDKVNTEGELIQKAMLSKVQKKYGIMPPDQAIKDVEIVNGQVMVVEQLDQAERKVPNGGILGVSSTETTSAVVTPIKIPLKLFKTQLQQQQQSTNRIKIYKCGFCAFQSKELSHVRFHMRSHKNETVAEKPILNQAAATTLTPKPQQKKQLYRCQVCSKTFDSRINCLYHIKKEHNQPTTSNSNEATETDEIVKEGRKTENVGNGEETENSQEDTTIKEVKSEPIPEPAQQEASEIGGEDEGDTAMPEQKKADQETPASVEKKTDVLDIETMLAAIHNDNPSNNSGDTKLNA